MKKFAFLFLFFCFGRLHAQDNSTITISGSVPDSMSYAYNNSREIWFYNYFTPRLEFNSSYINISPLTLKDRHFKVTFTPSKKFAFFKMDGFELTTPMMSMFLVRAGSNVTFHSIGNKNGYFTGTGASILNYQLWLGALMHSSHPPKNYRAWSDSTLAFSRSASKRYFQISADSLDSHRTEWGDETYTLVKTYTKSCLNAAYIGAIAPEDLFAMTDTAYRRLLLPELTDRLSVQFKYGYSHEPLLNYDFAYLMYMRSVITGFLKVALNQERPDFEYKYKFINDHFKGFTRDKLLTFEFISDIHTHGVYDYLAQAISTIKDTASRMILEKEMVKIPGVKAYDFSFQDVNGKSIKLADLKNKVVVVDFWFYGCENCVGMARQLRPIIERYRDSDVVFLSINTDNTKKKFIDGVKSGLYGGKDEVFGWVGSSGFFSPILQYYNFIGFPQVLIIDKKGILVSANPTRPFNDRAVKEWYTLLNSALK